MIRVTPKEPNFQVRVEPTGGGPEEIWLVHGADAADAKAQIELEGVWRAKSIEPYDFAVWRAKAAEETQKAIDAHKAGEPIKFKSAIWTALKQYLFFRFNSKCAYCEANVRMTDWGDVEHFRPKGSVAGDPRHPGYFWLAYEVTNLLPSCKRCNQGGGKVDQFPIGGTRVSAPGVLRILDGERALLIHPYFDDPSLHLGFVPDTGRVVGIDDRGRTMIAVCLLNRGDLDAARLQAQKNAQQELGLAIVTGGAQAFRAKYEEYRLGKQPFSAAAVAQAQAIVTAVVPRAA